MPSYTQNGILHMLDRNKRIKPRPERFQNCKDLFDLILTCEERVYDQVVEGEPTALCLHVPFVPHTRPLPGPRGPTACREGLARGFADHVQGRAC